MDTATFAATLDDTLCQLAYAVNDAIDELTASSATSYAASATSALWERWESAAVEVQGDHYRTLARIFEILRRDGYSVVFESFTGQWSTAHGLATGGTRIRLSARLNSGRAVQVLYHEWAHMVLHHAHYRDSSAPMPHSDSRIRELEAEAVAYIMCALTGHPLPDSGDYIAGYENVSSQLFERQPYIYAAVRHMAERLELVA